MSQVPNPDQANAAGSEPSNDASVENPTTLTDALSGEAPKPEEINKRLLEESRSFKDKWQTTKKELAALQKAQKEASDSALAEQGRYKELYEETKSKLQGFEESLVKERVKSAVTDLASKYGCVNVDSLLKLGNSGLLQYDEATHQVLGADAFVEDAKKTHSYLFQNKAQPVNPSAPGGYSGGTGLSEAQTKASVMKDPKSREELMRKLFEKERANPRRV